MLATPLALTPYYSHIHHCVCVCIHVHRPVSTLEAGLRDRQRRKCGCMRGRLGKTWAIIRLKIRFENILLMHQNFCNRYLTWNRKKHQVILKIKARNIKGFICDTAHK